MIELPEDAVGIQFVQMLDEKNGMLIFPDIKRDSVRFLFSYKGNEIALMWMNVKSDGSILLNERCDSGKIMHAATGIVNIDGVSELSEIRSYEIEEKEIPKITHHASGRVNTYDSYITNNRVDSVVFRSLKDLILFREDQYKDFNKYQIIENRRITDIPVLNYDGNLFELSDDLALHVRVYACPLVVKSLKISVDDRANVSNRVILVFPFVELTGECPDMSYAIEFFTAPARTEYPWASTTSILDVTIK